MTIQTKYSNWIDKNWQFKQNIQIELIKIENSNKTFKLNWKKLKIQTKYSNWIEKNWKFKQDIQTELKKIENSNNIIKLNWKKFELQIYGSVWFEIIWSLSQYMTKLVWIELNVESLIWAALSLHTTVEFICVVLAVLYCITDLMSLQTFAITTQSRGTMRTLQCQLTIIDI